MKRLIIAAALLLSLAAQAKEKQKATFTASENRIHERQGQIVLPGSAGTTTTDCSAYGNSATCTTQTYGAYPSRAVTFSTAGIEVVGVLVRDDGRKFKVRLWCAEAGKHCRRLRENETKEAELDGLKIKIFGKEALTDKPVTVKMKIIDAVEIKEENGTVQ
jgi:hypothetical protein